MITEHSKLFPFSSAHRWTGDACPGSIVLCLDEPDLDTESSREGTAAHWVVEEMFKSFMLRVDNDGTEAGKRLIGVAHPQNGVIITEEMYEHALGFYNTVTPIVKDKKFLFIEFRVHAPSIHEQAFGTLDLSYYAREKNLIHLWDYKYGHKSVKAVNNRQLVGYAQALCETWKMEDTNPRLSLNIYQPRCYYDGLGPVRNWLTTLDDIRGLVNGLRHAANVYEAGTAQVVSGEWCYECPARHKCPALTHASANAIDYSTQPVPVDMSNDVLAYELELTEAAFDRLKQRKDAIEAQAIHRITHGDLIPGRRMQDTFSNYKWNKPADEMIPIIKLFGVDPSKPVDIKTPTQVLGMLKKKGVDAAVIAPYYGKSRSGAVMVKDDGERAKLIFNQEKNDG